MDKKKLNALTQEEKSVIVDKNTEAPFTGKYDTFLKRNLCVCRRCNSPLISQIQSFIPVAVGLVLMMRLKEPSKEFLTLMAEELK